VTPAETSASLDELASPGVPLVQTARLLADQIGQVFGIAEMKQVSADGVIQLRYWSGVEQSPVAAWAKANSLQLSGNIANAITALPVSSRRIPIPAYPSA